jgi:branched-chain amino acid transport system ATP-binding protein
MSELLVVDNIHTYYGKSYVLQGLTIEVPRATVVALVGRNGMGKTTTMRSIMGFTPCKKGEIRFKGEQITRLEAYAIARRGIGLVPQGRQIFPSLSVRENIDVAARQSVKRHGWTADRVFSIFPRLKERLANKGNQLSGGEQQMLAIARALVLNPDLVLMDEPSEGLAPIVIDEVGAVIKKLSEEGIAVLLAEQNLPLALSVADSVYVVNKGSIVFSGPAQELRERPEIEREYLAV